ncbi:hypothetical protein [Absidia glauca]|uniref:Uncharacterized protein n=1 Tax=Absidia glauca TaxID=4829 RepID=A0A163JYW4_ABSGL|nr:hypothetical protein [Absidia glauca]
MSDSESISDYESISDNESLTDNESSITTIEELAEFFMKEMTGLKNHLAAANARAAAQSATSSAPIVGQPLNKTPIRKPTTASKRMKKPIVAAILDHLLEDTKFTFSDQVLKKVSASNSLSPKERQAFAVYDLLSMWARNIANEERMFTGESITFAKLPAAKQQELVQSLEARAAKKNLHISRCEGSWMATALLKEKFANHADNATRVQKKKGVAAPSAVGSLDEFLMLHPKRARRDSSSPSSLGRPTTDSVAASTSVPSSFSASASVPVSSSSPPPPSPAYASGSADSGPASA